MPIAHHAIKRPRPPTVRRNHHSAGTSRTSANAKDSQQHIAPRQAPENPLCQFHRTSTGKLAAPLQPRPDKRRGTPTAQRTVPPTSAGESHSPSHRASDSRPECRGIPSGRHGHFFKQKILPVLWLKGFSSFICIRWATVDQAPARQLSGRSPSAHCSSRDSSLHAHEFSGRPVSARSKAHRALPLLHAWCSQGFLHAREFSLSPLPRVGSSPSPQRMGSFCR